MPGCWQRELKRHGNREQLQREDCLARDPPLPVCDPPPPPPVGVAGDNSIGVCSGRGLRQLYIGVWSVLLIMNNVVNNTIYCEIVKIEIHSY